MKGFSRVPTEEMSAESLTTRANTPPTAGEGEEFAFRLNPNWLWHILCCLGAAHSIECTGVVPPFLKKRLEKRLWRRFWAHCVIAAHKNTMLLRALSVLFLLSFFALIYAMPCFDDDSWINDDRTFWAVFVPGMLFLLYAHWKVNQTKVRNYELLVSKMGPTFHENGFSVDYTPVHTCFRSHFFVDHLMRFTVNPPGLPQPQEVKEEGAEVARASTGVVTIANGAASTTDEDKEVGTTATANEDANAKDRGVFCPEDWRALEGQWERDSARSKSMIPWLFSIRSFVMTYGSASSEESFWGLHETHGYLCYLFNKESRIHYVASGNSLVFRPSGDGTQSRVAVAIKSISEMEPIPFPCAAGDKQAQAAARPNTCYYRNGRTQLYHVQGSRMKIYVFHFEEDCPTDAEIFGGALNNLPEDGSCGYVYNELERTARAHAVDDNVVAMAVPLEVV